MPTAQLLNALAVLCWPAAHLLVRGNAARKYVIDLVIGCFMVQFVARGALDRLPDQRLAATRFGWIACAITLTQWLCILYIDYSKGYVVYDDENASLLVLSISTIFIQGIIVCGANGYCAARCVVQGLAYIALVSAIVYRHVPSGPDLLLPKAEYLVTFIAIDLALHALAVSQIRCACKQGRRSNPAPRPLQMTGKLPLRSPLHYYMNPRMTTWAHNGHLIARTLPLRPFSVRCQLASYLRRTACRVRGAAGAAARSPLLCAGLRRETSCQHQLRCVSVRQAAHPRDSRLPPVPERSA